MAKHPYVHGLRMVPGEPAAERDSFGDVVLVGRLREAIHRLNPRIPPRTLANLRDTLLPKLLSGEVNTKTFANFNAKFRKESHG